MDFLNCLEKFEFIKCIEVLEFRIFKDGFFIKIKTLLTDESLLFIREYVDSYERNYSYHWQDAQGNLIARWDNAPHYPEIITYPHHKHVGKKILPSYSITCEEILEEIRKMLLHE